MRHNALPEGRGREKRSIYVMLSDDEYKKVSEFLKSIQNSPWGHLKKGDALGSFLVLCAGGSFKDVTKYLSTQVYNNFEKMKKSEGEK